jgi:hypothetical protein
MDKDEEHLKLLSIFHYVLGGIMALFACFPIIHLTIGIVMLVAPEVFQEGRGPEPPMMLLGLMFTIIPGLIILAGWSLAVCVFLSGRWLSLRRHYTFCLVVAALSCLFMPLGTLLGVFTIIVLVRPSVKALFEARMGNPFGH